MGWLNILGTLAQAVMGHNQQSVSSDPTRVSRLGRGSDWSSESGYPLSIVPEAPRDEVAEAEAETRRMLEEAYRDMVDERVTMGVRPVEKRINETSAKVIDLETNTHSRLDSMQRTMDDIQLSTGDIEKLGRKANVLLGAVAVIAAMCLYLIYKSF